MDGKRQQEMVDHFKKVRGMGHAEAVTAMEIFEMGFDTGRKQGQSEAQRFFRLTLGLEKPTAAEEAYWTHPVPLKERR